MFLMFPVQVFGATSVEFTASRDALNFIGGHFVHPSHPTGSLDVINPRYGRKMASVTLSGN